MSNIFKNNSRFAGLVDKPEFDKSVKLTKKMGSKEGEGLGKNQYAIKTLPEVEKRESNQGLEFKEDEKKTNTFNPFKDNGFRENSFRENGYGGARRQNSYFSEGQRQRYREQYEAEQKARKEFEENEKERLKQEALKIENFPDLVVQDKKYMQKEEQSMNFIETIKKGEKVVDPKNIDPDLVNLKEGWVLYKRDPITRKTIIKRHPSDIRKEVEESQHSAELEKENIKEIFRALSELHERRTNEFIELYGYDTWEKMFKFPDWREREAELEETDSEDDYYDEEEEENIY
jgi:hypothetical protein